MRRSVRRVCRHANRLHENVVPRGGLESIDTGSATITWEMKAAYNAKTRNGFLVLSGDERATISDLGKTWKFTAVTRNSSATNMRPVCGRRETRCSVVDARPLFV